jgi:hypothetical protein
MLCPICGKEMYDNRENKKSPKAPDYRCKNKECKFEFDKVSNEWVAGEYTTAIWLPKGTPKEAIFTPKPKEPKKSLLNAYDSIVKPEEKKKEAELIKEVVSNRDASIVAQVLMKVKAQSGAYKDSEGVAVENINEKIYDDYIFFLNRLSND